MKMKTVGLFFGVVALSGASSFAGAKSYQVTGPVLEVSDTQIIVQKGKDKWELKRDASTKGAAGVKVGDKVTVYYEMTATEVEAKPAKKGK